MHCQGTAAIGEPTERLVMCYHDTASIRPTGVIRPDTIKILAYSNFLSKHSSAETEEKHEHFQTVEL